VELTTNDSTEWCYSKRAYLKPSDHPHSYKSTTSHMTDTLDHEEHKIWDQEPAPYLCDLAAGKIHRLIQAILNYATFFLR
jgi:hypothetical protein